MEESETKPREPIAGSNKPTLSRNDVAANDVVDWMLQGASGAQITQALLEKYPTANVQVVLQLAGDHFEEIGKSDMQLLRGWCFEATRDLYRRMIEIGDYPNAMRAIKQMRDFTK